MFIQIFLPDFVMRISRKGSLYIYKTHGINQSLISQNAGQLKLCFHRINNIAIDHLMSYFIVV